MNDLNEIAEYNFVSNKFNGSFRLLDVLVHIPPIYIFRWHVVQGVIIFSHLKVVQMEENKSTTEHITTFSFTATPSLEYTSGTLKQPCCMWHNQTSGPQPFPQSDRDPVIMLQCNLSWGESSNWVVLYNFYMGWVWICHSLGPLQGTFCWLLYTNKQTEIWDFFVVQRFFKP